MSAKVFAAGSVASALRVAQMLLMACTAWSPAWAQDSGEPARGGVLEEITVSARKRDESIVKTPVPITALTADSLQIKGIEDRRDLNRFTPGFNAAPQNTSAATRLINAYGMRGLGTVNLFWNGVPLNGGDIPELLDLERVEVLKGPQTAYFGRSTFSGAINFIAKQPGHGFHGDLQADLSSFDSHNYKGAVESDLIEGVLAGRLSVGYRKVGAQYDNFGYGGKLGEQTTKAGTASLLYTPASGLRARIYYANWEERDGPNAISYLQSTDYDCNAGAAPTTKPNYFCGEISRSRADRISQLPIWPQSVIDQITAIATTNTVSRDFITFNGMKRRGELAQAFIDYDLPFGLTASLTGSWMKNEAGQIFDYASRFYTTPNTYNPSITTYVFRDKYGEFRLASDQQRRVRGLVGVSYVDSAQTIQSVISKSGVISVSFVPTILYSKTLGIFGSASYDLSDKFTATLEGRYQEDQVGRQTIGVSDLSGYTYSFVPRATLEYHVSDFVNTFLSYSEGSRPGALNTGFLALPVYAQAQVIAQYNVPRIVPEERLKNYEIGIKGDFLDHTLRILGNAYYAKWTNRQIGATLFYRNLNGVLAQANVTLGAGAVDAKGTEWELTWAPLRNLSFDATAAYNWTSIVNTTCAQCALITGSATPTGTKYPRFPLATASLGVTFRQPAFSDFEGYYRLDANYQGTEYADETNVVWLSPWVQSNARIGLENKRYRIEIYGLNIFDNRVPQSIALTQDQISGKNTLTTTPPLKRMFGLRGEYKF